MLDIKHEVKPNAKQKECIETLEGPVMVLAGPGTGKTFTVTYRIKNMIEKGIAPDKILCLTFTDTAASEMKKRLIKELGLIASNISIYTYHAFCLDIIKQNPSQFALLEKFEMINPTVKINLIKEVLSEVEIVNYRTKVYELYGFINEFLEQIAILKSSKTTKEEFFEAIKNHSQYQKGLDEAKGMLNGTIPRGRKQDKGLIAKIEECDKRIKKAKELWTIYELYCEKMRKNNLIDFNDMINLVLEAFENDKTFLKEISERFDYFLVDEYQDTNNSQNAILFSLLSVKDKKNIFVVGDDDQIIYAFQGANRNNFENFLGKFPNTKVICLKENMRSTQNILDFSYKVINQDETRLEFNPSFKKYQIDKKLIAKNEEIISRNKLINLNTYDNIIQEFNGVVDKIEEIIKSDEIPKNDKNEPDLSQIAILLTKNEPLEFYGELLKNRGIPFQIKKGRSIFAVKSSILLYFYLKALENNVLWGDKLFGLLISPPFNMPLDDYENLWKIGRKNKKDFIQNMRDLKEKPLSVQHFLEVYDYLKKYKYASTLKNIIIETLNKTGMLEYFLNEETDRLENILAIQKFIDEAKSFILTNPTACLNDFIIHLDEALTDGIEITTDEAKHTQNAVQLSTYHSSKGREFEFVFLPDLVEKKWEKKTGANSKMVLPIQEELDESEKKINKKSEQLKLLFVGITRAKSSLTISYSLKNDKSSQVLTSYISNIKDEKLKLQDFSLLQDDNVLEIAKTIKRNPFDENKNFKREIQEIADKITLSPSSLNEYLNCPRGFFYNKILKIEVKDSDFDVANYGSAIHEALEFMVNEAKEKGEYPSLDEFLKTFEEKLENQIITTVEKKKEFLKRGLKNLGKYYEKLKEADPNSILHLEYPFELQFDDNLIIGKIDRIEKFPDGTFGLYDYKTGTAKPKSSMAEGKLYERHFNQLRFYKYAFEKLNNAKVSDVGLIFPEDFEGNVHLELTDNDNKNIENKIRDVFKKIKNLEFEAPEKTQDRCKFCEHKELCKLDVL